MEAQRARVGGQLQPAVAQVAVHLVALGDRPGFVPDVLAQTLHLLRRRAAGQLRRRGAHGAQLPFQAGEQFAELQPQRSLSQLQAATGTARAAVVVAFAELVGVLETVGAATQRARLVLAVEDPLVDAQRPEQWGPVTMRAGLEVPDARFEIIVHDVLASMLMSHRCGAATGPATVSSPSPCCCSPHGCRMGVSRSCRCGGSSRIAGSRRPCAARARRTRGTSCRCSDSRRSPGLSSRPRLAQ